MTRVKVAVLRGRNFWTVPIPVDCSSIWKQVLKLRQTAMLHVRYIVGKGDRVSLWFDPWVSGSAVNPSPSLLQNSGLPPTAKVADIIQNANWCLPTSNYHDVIVFRRQIELLPVPPNCDDKILWNSLDIKRITAGQIWDTIRGRQQQVGWHKLVWHRLFVPRFSFILWLGMLRKLPTNDVTRNFSNGRIMQCPLCSMQT